MNTIVRLGVAAAVLAMAVALGYSLLQNIGDHEPAPGPNATEDASPTGSPSAGLPPELRRVFIGEPRDVPGIEVVDRFVIDLTAQIFRLHTGGGRVALISAARAEDETLRLETVVGSTACAEGDVGTYPYTFSPGGTVLTLEVADDSCSARADALVGEWRLSACLDAGNWCLGELEAGTQRSLFFDPFRVEWGQPVTRYGALTYEAPEGWANADDRTHIYTLLRTEDYDLPAPFECHDCPDGLWIGANPRAVEAGCSEEADPEIGGSVDDLAAWIRAHPGLEASDGESVSVDGRPTVTLDVSASESWADACRDEEMNASFAPLFTHPGYTYGIRIGDRHRLILVEIDADSAMLVSVDSFEPEDLESVIAETRPIIDSIQLNAP